MKGAPVQDIITARTLADAYILRDVLTGEGITTTIRNEHLIGTAGDVPVRDTLPTIAVADQDADRARAILRDRLTDESAASALDDPDDGAGSDFDGSEAQVAMSELHTAATRLIRDPGVGEAIDDVQRHGTRIAGTGAPFGVEPAAWSRIGVLAEATVAAADDEDELVITATQLRDVLEPLV